MMRTLNRGYVRLRVEIHPMDDTAEGGLKPTSDEAALLCGRLSQALMDGRHLVSEAGGTPELPRFLVTMETWR